MAEDGRRGNSGRKRPNRPIRAGERPRRRARRPGAANFVVELSLTMQGGMPRLDRAAIRPVRPGGVMPAVTVRIGVPSEAPSAEAPPSGPRPRLVGAMFGRNLVEFEGVYMAVPRRLGTVDVAAADFLARHPSVLSAPTRGALARALWARWFRWAYWDGAKGAPL